MSGPSDALYKVILKDGHLDPSAGPVDLNEMFAAIGREKPGHIVIHLHGGLISRQAGESAADRLDTYYRQSDVLPLFIVWESGWSEIIEQRLSAISRESIFQRILARTAQFVRGKLDKQLGPEGGKGDDDEMTLIFQAEIDKELASGRIGGPMFDDLPLDQLPPDAVSRPDADGLAPAERQQIEQEIADDRLLPDQLLALDAGRGADPDGQSKGTGSDQPVATLMDQEVLDSIVPPRDGTQQSRSVLSALLLARRIANVVARIVYRLSRKRDHGPYLTIVEEVLREFYVGSVGKFLWDGMKTAVANAFTSQQAGGVALVAALRGMWNEGLHPKLTLVGHSAGGIYAARLLKELHAVMPPECKIDLILIAPACTFKALADALRVAGNRITGIRVFGMGDPIERKDAIASFVYPASLLYFVSGVLEDDPDEPLVGMQRYYSALYESESFPEIATVKAFDYLTREHAFAWSLASGFEGANSDMMSHGGWVDAEQTRLSVMSVVSKGYAYT